MPDNTLYIEEAKTKKDEEEGFLIRKGYAKIGIVLIIILFIASIVITYYASSSSDSKQCLTKSTVSIPQTTSKFNSDQICTNLLCQNPFILNGY